MLQFGTTLDVLHTKLTTSPDHPMLCAPNMAWDKPSKGNNKDTATYQARHAQLVTHQPY